MKVEDARLIVKAFADDSPEAYRLALAASLAARVEPELVRALRLKLFAGLEAGAEADLWFSPLVQSQTPTALEFEPETLELLRQDLAKDQELLRRTWELLKEFHSSAPYAMRLQEELTWLGLSHESNQAIIEARLQAVFAEVKAGRRAGLARWASRALPSLPEKTRESESARRLSVAAGVQTGVGPVLSVMPSKGMIEDWIGEVSAKAISRVKVGVRILKNDTPELQVELNRPAGPGQEAPNGEDPGARPMLIEFSYPPVPDAEVIEVPDTYRLLLEVSWLENEQRLLRQLSLLPDETRRIEVDYGEVNIRTALGDIITVRPRFDYDFMLLYDVALEGWARNLVERLDRQQSHDRPLKIAVAPVDESILNVPNASWLGTTFSLSRKVGMAVSDSPLLKRLESARPEPTGWTDWRIPITGTSLEPLRQAGGINFSRPEEFEESFRSLWKAITGEDPPRSKTSTEPDVRSPQSGVSFFISYAHFDKPLRDILMTHLAILQTEGLVSPWNDLPDGGMPLSDWDSEISQALETAQIILLLVSPNYLASEYAGVEATRAMRRHASGEARVIPVILAPCEWKESLGQLQALPSDGQPVTTWSVREEAFANIAEGVRRVAEELQRESRQAGVSQFLPRPPVMGFVARRDSEGRDIVERLKEELAPQRLQMISLTGMGGSGKTALAAEAVRGLQSAYAGRIIWVPADAHADFTFSTLLDQIALQLGVREVPRLAIDGKRVEVGALLSSRPTLVVLDNFETISSDQREQIVSWLEQANCSVLITSRERIEKVRNLVVSAMAINEANEFLGRLIEQATERKVFSSDVRQRIVEASEANPLVMQWVVQQVDLGQQPDVVLDKLRHGEGDAATRVFDRSFELTQLGDDGRAALLALSLFAPSARRGALGEVAGFESDLGRLDEAVKNLAALSMIRTTDNDRRLAVEGLTRELARARLSQDKRADEFRRRFVDHFRSYTESHSQPTPADYEALEVEKDNLLGAVETAFALSDWSSVMKIAEIATGPVAAVLGAGSLAGAVRIGELAVQAARLSQNQAQLARSSANLAAIFYERGELERARQLYSESLGINEKLDNVPDRAVVLHQLGRLAQDQGDFDKAQHFFSESLTINERIGNQSGVATALYQLGNLTLARGQFDEAQYRYRRSLEISRQLDDHRAIAGTLRQLSNLALAEQRFEYAERDSRESLEIERRLGNQDGIASSLSQLGTVAEGMARFKEAQANYRESLEIRKKLNDQSGIAMSLSQLGALAQDAGEHAEARRLYDESLTIYRQLGYRLGVARTLYQLGVLSEQEFDRGEAIRLLQESLNIFTSLKSPEAEKVQRALSNLASPNTLS